MSIVTNIIAVSIGSLIITIFTLGVLYQEQIPIWRILKFKPKLIRDNMYEFLIVSWIVSAVTIIVFSMLL